MIFAGLMRGISRIVRSDVTAISVPTEVAGGRSLSERIRQIEIEQATKPAYTQTLATFGSFFGGTVAAFAYFGKKIDDDMRALRGEMNTNMNMLRSDMNNGFLKMYEIMLSQHQQGQLVNKATVAIDPSAATKLPSSEVKP